VTPALLTVRCGLEIACWTVATRRNGFAAPELLSTRFGSSDNGIANPPVLPVVVASERAATTFANAACSSRENSRCARSGSRSNFAKPAR